MLCPFSEPFDFTGNMWPVDFLANQASASFEISIVQDNLPETREEFSLKIVIENPYDERVTVGEPPRLTVVITGRYAKPTDVSLCTCQCICMYVCLTLNWEQLPLTIKWQGRLKRQRSDLQSFGSSRAS